jgi:hypothetical protein
MVLAAPPWSVCIRDLFLLSWFNFDSDGSQSEQCRRRIACRLAVIRPVCFGRCLHFSDADGLRKDAAGFNATNPRNLDDAIPVDRVDGVVAAKKFAAGTTLA